MNLRPQQIASFRKVVYTHYRTHGRDLPWRRTKNPYRILVSEVMLQQTQVPRVLDKYKEFVKAFPTIRSLAQAPLRDVVAVWSGLGYNRRALALKRLAETVVHDHNAKIPRDVDTLKSLPGIGPACAGAIAAFDQDFGDGVLFGRDFVPTWGVVPVPSAVKIVAPGKRAPPGEKRASHLQGRLTLPKRLLKRDRFAGQRIQIRRGDSAHLLARADHIGTKRIQTDYDDVHYVLLTKTSNM